ncbi:MAG: hypothetical protein KUG73_15025 [Pseudomonadales bacterium]|nr:hypothetical protein [Pseudomonadales bacterium]
MKSFLKIALAVIALVFSALAYLVIENNLSKDLDATYELRGRYKASGDGKTYLVIEDDNGGKCGPLYVDKKVWPHGIDARGEVEAGDHSIECGGWMGVSIREGSTYYFDYWGP